MKDFYYILGIDINSTCGEIDEAYQKLFERFHPELNGGDKYFHNRFSDIQEAYNTLSNPVKRRKYDAAFKKHLPSRGNRAKHYFNAIDVAFTIILILVTLLFADYVIKNLSSYKNSKTVTVIKSPVDTTVVYHTAKYHIIKHSVGVKRNNILHKYNPIYASHVLKIISEPIKVEKDTAKPQPVQPVPVNYKKPGYSPKFLYETYIIANVTGVVNMREQANLSSAIVQVLPNNAKIAIIEKGDVYYKALYKNDTGYIPKWSVAVK